MRPPRRGIKYKTFVHGSGSNQPMRACTASRRCAADRYACCERACSTKAGIRHGCRSVCLHMPHLQRRHHLRRRRLHHLSRCCCCCWRGACCQHLDPLGHPTQALQLCLGLHPLWSARRSQTHRQLHNQHNPAQSSTKEARARLHQQPCFTGLCWNGWYAVPCVLQ